MAEILKGAPVAAAITEKVAADTEALRQQGITPTLAIVRIGDNPNDLAYERAAMKRAKKAGVEVRNEVFAESISESEFFAELARINRDKSVHGVLMMQPLPEHINGAAAREMIEPEKDIDGCTAASMAGVFAGMNEGFPPCTAEAAMEMLRYYGVEIQGKKAAVIGRSLVIGRPVAMMLMHENATVVNCHTKTEDVPGITRDADILIAAAGRLRSVTPEYTNPNQVIIDVGINWDEESQSIAGDADFDAVEPVVQAISPVPGGVGSVTSSILMKHVAEAARRAADREPADMLDGSTKEFLSRLGSKDAVPGGGGASALAGALGASLGIMVAALTVGKKKYAEHEEELKSMMAEMEDLSGRLAACVSKDAEMFAPLAEAYGMPKDAPGRDEVLEKCLSDAAATPLEIMELCCSAIELLEGFAAMGSKLAVSDAATGAALCRGALCGAAVNVKVNTRLMKNREHADALDSKADALLSEYSGRADAIVEEYYGN